MCGLSSENCLYGPVIFHAYNAIVLILSYFLKKKKRKEKKKKPLVSLA